MDVKDFQKEVIEASKEKPVIVDFWATWCGPCRMLTPIFEEVAKDMKEKAVFVKIQLDGENEAENQKIAAEYGVRGIPNLLIFKNGEAIDSIVGVLQKEPLKAKIEEIIK